MSGGANGWRALLLRIGDKCPEYAGCSGFKEHIDVCYSNIWRELEHSKDDIFEMVMQCAAQLPHKHPLYGVLVGLINLEDELFSTRVVNASVSHLQEALDLGSCDAIRIMMRFITTLMCSKVIGPSSIIEIFETLLSSAATILAKDTSRTMQPCGDFYVASVLSCLPWGAMELIEQVPEEFDKLIDNLQSYLKMREPSHNVGFRVFELDENNGPESKDFLEDLWYRTEVMSRNGWKADCVPRPQLSFEAQLVAGKSHDLPAIYCPNLPRPSLETSDYSLEEKHVVSVHYLPRIYRLNIFPSNKVENMQPIDRFIVEEYLLDILLFLNGCRKECASYMVGLPLPFRYEYLMAETIFSQILLLPQPRFKMMYYTLVIIDLCKALPGAFPTVVAGAVRALFDRIDDMDMECRTRLILWFSQHLANFEYVWPWEEWAHIGKLPKWAPQRVFVQEVLEREIRLSYWEKIKLSIENASDLEELLPSKEGARFKYNNIEENQDNMEGRKVSSELIGMVKGKKNIQEIISWIMETIIPKHGPRLTLEVVAQTLLELGSKSFTHLITVLERYGQIISKLCPDHDDQLRLLNEVSSYWKNNSQMVAITFDRLMGYLLVSNLAIVSWVFSPVNVERFHTTHHPWEILRNTVNKTFNRINDLKKEIASLKKGVISSEISAAKAKEELENAESVLELVNGQPVLLEKPGRLKRLKGYADRSKELVQNVRESLAAKEALLDQVLSENKALYLSLYRNFARVLKQRLPPLTSNGKIPDLKGGLSDAMSVDSEEPSNIDAENTGSNDRGTYSYKTGEQEQWCLTTLGYVKAFSRQYASEILPHMEALDSEVLDVAHPLFLKAVYEGLGRPSLHQ